MKRRAWLPTVAEWDPQAEQSAVGTGWRWVQLSPSDAVLSLDGALPLVMVSVLAVAWELMKATAILPPQGSTTRGEAWVVERLE